MVRRDRIAALRLKLGESHQQVVEDIPKPDRDELKKIRQLFLRLADSFHPDKKCYFLHCRDYRYDRIFLIQTLRGTALLTKVLTMCTGPTIISKMDIPFVAFWIERLGVIFSRKGTKNGLYAISTIW